MPRKKKLNKGSTGPQPFYIEYPERIDHLCENLRVPMFLTIALPKAKISKSAYYNWLAEAEELEDVEESKLTQQQRVLLETVERIRDAKADGAALAAHAMAEGFGKDWRAAKDFLTLSGYATESLDVTTAGKPISGFEVTIVRPHEPGEEG